MVVKKYCYDFIHFWDEEDLDSLAVNLILNLVLSMKFLISRKIYCYMKANDCQRLWLACICSLIY